MLFRSVSQSRYLEVTNGISGSLTKLTNGTSYIIAGNYISVVSQSNGSITISGTGVAPLSSQYVTIGNDSTLTNERSLTAGTGLLLTDGGANSTVTLEINDSIVATVSGTTFTGVTNHSAGLSGSLTKLTNGSSYLIAGSNISITSASNGSVTITNTFKQVDDFFDSTTAGSIFTTGSAAFIGQEALIDSPGDKGIDVFFYVSGSTVAAKKDVALFGGTVVISGSMVQGNFDVSGGATAKFARAHGERTTASGPSSHAEGRFSVAQGANSHAEGDSTVTYGQGSHAEGLDSATFIAYSHAEGRSTEARAFYSHAEGYDSITRADYSHTEGRDTQTLSTALYAHAEGYGSVAIGVASHAEGLYTLASGSNQLAVGKYNKRDNVDSLFVVGNGTGDSAANRSDIFRVNSSDVQITGSLVQKTSGVVGFMGSDTRTYPTTVGTDVFFYVSGSSGSLGKSTRGVAAFGGDVMITGSLKVGTTSVTIDRNGIQFGSTIRKIVGKSNGNISILGTSELTGSFYTSDRTAARYFGGSVDVLSTSPVDFGNSHLTVCEPPTNPQIINLSDGRHDGQVAHFVNRTGSGQVRITPTNTLGTWTYVNLSEAIGASATLIWTGSDWAFMGGYLATVV